MKGTSIGKKHTKQGKVMDEDIKAFKKELAELMKKYEIQEIVVDSDEFSDFQGVFGEVMRLVRKNRPDYKLCDGWGIELKDLE